AGAGAAIARARAERAVGLAHPARDAADRLRIHDARPVPGRLAAVRVERADLVGAPVALGRERRAGDALGVRAAHHGAADAVAADAAAAVLRRPAHLAVGRARVRPALAEHVAAVAAGLVGVAEQAVGQADLLAADAVEAVVGAARNVRVAGGAVGVADGGAADAVGTAGAGAALGRVVARGAVGLADRLRAQAVLAEHGAALRWARARRADGRAGAAAEAGVADAV